MTVEGTKKRKYTSKELHPIHYFEDSESNNSKAGDCSGDGSSSGNSMVSAPVMGSKLGGSQKGLGIYLIPSENTGERGKGVSSSAGPVV